jgi:2-methylisocitrate lyase-like PEP mutase family enzyme
MRFPVPQPSPAANLRDLLRQPEILVMPCCFDALSARLIERTGFPLAFMDGFAVTLARLGLPDGSLISYGEMVDHGRDICSAVSIPVIGDGGDSHGTAMNVKRTVHGYAAAGFAGIVIGDRTAAKTNGGTPARGVVDRDEALIRLRAACDARDEGAGIVIVARTDAGTGDDFDEALWRARTFADQGADVVFLGTPCSDSDLERFCAQVPALKMVTMVEHGDAANSALDRLQAMDVKLTVDPLTPMTAAAGAMERALTALKERRPVIGAMEAAKLEDIAGVPRYVEIESGYVAENGVLVGRPTATVAIPYGRTIRTPRSAESEEPQSTPGHWIVGALFAIVGVFSLYLASKAEDQMMYAGGIGFFIASVLFIFLLIKKVTDSKH